MEPAIKRALERLERENLIIEVKDHVTGSSIVSKNDKITGSKMIEQSGSIENWLLDHVKAKGYEKIQIQLFAPRGNAAVREGLALNMGFGERPKPEENRTVQPLPTQQGLNAPTGLAMADHLGLLVDRRELERVREELKQEKEKADKLAKEKEQLESDKRHLEKSNDNKVFWGGLLKEALPALNGLASMATQSKGLAAPQQQPSLDIPQGAKGELINVILNAEGISDDQVVSIYYVLEAFSNNNQAFVNALEQLFTEHNIKANGNSQSNGQ
ncbi:hypothetical protein [Aquimarina litoralis]|uniref:hypothetical protein n=1 Tax=Aquimarina litoralis TaxID=584605 RepID=UPI001C561FD3|nr:hypothetical protein [Aquimarina litoralis]MBW1296435.1 hypothetical protein [Aquimarina litoralis]